jgi:hypothetical protein
MRMVKVYGFLDSDVAICKIICSTTDTRRAPEPDTRMQIRQTGHLETLVVLLWLSAQDAAAVGNIAISDLLRATVVAWEPGPDARWS